MSLAEFAAETDRCSQCSYCKWIPFDHVQSWRFAKNCPSVAFHNFNSYSARGRYAVARSLLKGDSECSDAVRRIAFTCLTCGSCDVSCKICRYNLEPLEMVRELKFHLVEQGQALDEHKHFVARRTAEVEPGGSADGRRGAWAEGLDVPRAPSDKIEVLFHAGCRISFDPELQRSARETILLLRNAGVRLGLMGEHEICCGGRIYSMGYREDFRTLAEANLQAWARAGVKTVVTSCADGYHAFKRLYPRLGSQVEVLHTVELVARLIREGAIRFRSRVPLTVTYHDPCHLGRQGEPYVPWNGVEKKIRGQVVAYEPRRPRYNGAWGIYDPPRDILRSIPGIELVEMERIREYSWCCGAGGGVREAYPEYSQWTAVERIAEARATGAEALVSACPWCERNFLDGLKASSDPLKIFDVLDLVRMAL
jgi:Fe-S oxidoreductase